ncbi:MULTISPECIES: lipoyl(octanoyl) transferase LipB [unclassified Arcicella]|uniref:lipoyl(octanoyl) transferase LipB n=1 Tax=unclassified Arcicella TaxID=2644986 RepID=UPI002864ACB5|nr:MULTISPECIES: lipoyl(octanoyl) transferase LipB [unclassified Arcicella]MDR6564916.1 lipoyl(octanoyl) transferase [Arcicella sp. BE51]MDR6814706.1 lipoyl(octanoyl) transferase [Arcicella sp. BE140]MDR6826131.1 lipoyl(octanoyl) transferase [Arcicella sp. BE139]
MIHNKTVIFQNLGLIDYQTAWDYQEKLHAEIVGVKLNNKHLALDSQVLTPNYLLFCEHPHVYTLGKSGKPEHLLLDEAGLENYEAKYYKINRGGDITYHGKGQLVGYPIFDLENFFTDIHKYMRFLEESVIRTCADFGIDAGRIQGLTGVWIDYVEQKNPRKICAMGVKASRWVTMHGFALNVNTDLNYFKHIVPCGIEDKAVTSIEQELGKPQDFQEVSDRMAKHLQDIFEIEALSDRQ